MPAPRTLSIKVVSSSSLKFSVRALSVGLSSTCSELEDDDDDDNSAD